MYRAIASIALAGLLIAALGLPVTSRAQPNDQLRLLAVDSGDFPTVQIDVRYAPRDRSVAPAFAVELGGHEATVLDATPLRQAPTVGFVADLSALMGDQLTPFVSRFDVMKLRLKDMLGQLRSVEAAEGSQASLVVMNESVTLMQPLTSDLVALVNAIDANQEQPFAPQALGPGSEAAPYPLGEAIKQALQQLAAGSASAPRALVVFAAGNAQQPVNTSELEQLVGEARAAGQSLDVLMIGLGSAQPGGAQRIAADPAGLERVARALGGRFVNIAGRPTVEQYRAIDSALAAVLSGGEGYRLRVRPTQLAGGTAQVRVAVNGLWAETTTDLPALLPQFTVNVDSSQPGKYQLTIEPMALGAEPVRAQYMLDNRVVADPIADSPNFALMLDMADLGFQQRFPPGTYTLSAAIWDASGQERRADQTVRLVVPPVSSDIPWVWLLAPGALLVVVVAMVALWAVRRNGRRVTSEALVWQPAVVGDNDETNPIRRPPVEPPDLDEVTKPFNRLSLVDDEITTRLGPTPPKVPELQWALEVLEGEPQRTIKLPAGDRIFDIGRPSRQGRPPAVALSSTSVSRETHATLASSAQALTLLAAETMNGTYIGEDREPLEPNQERDLAAGDIFWVGAVKLRVTRKVADHA
jgi:hypothetical protein